MDGRIELIDSPRALKLRYGRASVQIEYCANQRTERAEFALASLADNAAFQSVLRAGTLQTIHSREATLEDIFIRVTGRRLV
jgi:fluoroquinolone transport system ATP-binding protein